VTLIELIVVMGIIAVLSTVVVVSQTNFNKTMLLSNAAYDVALAIRSAETYGLGSRTTGTIKQNSGYGVHFEPGTKSFIIFADNDSPADGCHKVPATGPSAPNATPGNCVYVAASDVLVQTLTLGNNTTIADACVLSNSGWTCAPTLTKLDMVFARPNTETYLSKNGVYAADNTKAYVKLTSPQGGASYVCIYKTGVISVLTSSDSC